MPSLEAAGLDAAPSSFSLSSSRSSALVSRWRMLPSLIGLPAWMPGTEPWWACLGRLPPGAVGPVPGIEEELDDDEVLLLTCWTGEVR